MVEVSGGSRMMPTLDLQNVCESGCGVTIGGFHCKTMDMAQNLSALQKKMRNIDTIAQCEYEGYVLVVACSSKYLSTSEIASVDVFRREHHRFFSDLQKFISVTKARNILGLSLSGSLGSFTLTVLYQRPSPGE